MPTCKLTRKTLSHILLHVFCLHFLRIHHNYFFWKSVPAQFLSGNISGLLVICLFNYDPSKSTFSMLNMQLDVLLSTVFVKLIGTFSFLAMKRLQEQSSVYCVLICTILQKLNCSPSWWQWFSILFWHLYQIQTFINNLNDEEMTRSHLMCTFSW